LKTREVMEKLGFYSNLSRLDYWINKQC
jgi:hypothetical protein